MTQLNVKSNKTFKRITSIEKKENSFKKIIYLHQNNHFYKYII